jgi:uncharacterized protein
MRSFHPVSFMKIRSLALMAAAVLALISFSFSCAANEREMPWGSATAATQSYQGAKAVFDVTAGTPAELNRILDRASFLSQMNGDDPFDVRIVIVIHGNAIPFFATKHYAQYQALMRRAYNTTLGRTIEFRMCQAAARLQGFAPKDIHGFVTMVPMAEAEITRLQQAEGFAYLR